MKAVIEVDLNEFGNGVALRAMLQQLVQSFNQIPDGADLVKTLTAEKDDYMILCEVAEPDDTEHKIVARAALIRAPINAKRFTDVNDSKVRREEVSLPAR